MATCTGRSPGPPAVAAVTLLLLLALLLPSGWAGPSFTLLVGSTPAVLLLLALRRRAKGWLAASIALTAGLVGGGFLLLLAMRNGNPVERWLVGLPLAMGIQVWLLAVIPLVLLGGLYGLGFSRWSPSPDELDRLKVLTREDVASGSEPDE